PLHAEAQFAGTILLELAGGERRSRAAAALFLLDIADRPLGFFEGSPDLNGLFLVSDFDFFITAADEAGIERRGLGRRQVGVNGPIFFLFKSLDFALSFNNKTQGHS